MTAPLERTVNPQELDPAIVRLLPYPFAKSKGVIAARVTGGALEVWLRPVPQASTLAEVRRMAGKPLKEVLLSASEFEHCLNLAYTREPNAAENIIEDMGDGLDLAKLTEALTIKGVWDNSLRELNQIVADLQRLNLDQDRIRKNLATTPKEAEVYQTYLKKLSDQEKEIDVLTAKQKKLMGEEFAAKKKFEDHLANLSE